MNKKVMQKMKKIFTYVMVALMFVVPTISLAMEFRSGNQPAVRADEKITNDLYMAGGSVTSFGSITGDLVAGGGNIVINGNVGADILAGGGNVSILGSVGDDVRVGGGNIIIGGKVGGDVLAGGGQISIIGPGVAGDVSIGGGDIRIDAPIGGKLWIGGKSVYINSPIAGDININAESVTLGSSAVISGNLTYKAGSELIRETGAVVNGKINFTPRPTKMVSSPTLLKILSLLILGKFLALLFCALLVGLILRRYSLEIIASARRRPLLELGRGLLILIAMPIISILLFFTLVGIPFGILGLLGFVGLMIFAWILTPIIVGSVVYSYFSKKDLEVSFKTIVLGVFLYSIIEFVPFVGFAAQFLLMLLALGSVAMFKIKILKDWR